MYGRYDDGLTPVVCVTGRGGKTGADCGCGEGPEVVELVPGGGGGGDCEGLEVSQALVGGGGTEAAPRPP